MHQATTYYNSMGTIYTLPLLLLQPKRVTCILPILLQIKQLEKLLSIEEEDQKSDVKPKQSMVCLI